MSWNNFFDHKYYERIHVPDLGEGLPKEEETTEHSDMVCMMAKFEGRISLKSSISDQNSEWGGKFRILGCISEGNGR